MSSRSKDREYRIWRILVIKRDNCCIICSSKKRRSVHHINNWKYHPDERYDVTNGVTLCSKCHVKYHTAYKYSYREKTTRKNFENFIQLIDYLKDVEINKNVQELYENTKK